MLCVGDEFAVVLCVGVELCVGDEFDVVGGMEVVGEEEGVTPVPAACRLFGMMPLGMS